MQSGELTHPRSALRWITPSLLRRRGKKGELAFPLFAQQGGEKIKNAGGPLFAQQRGMPSEAMAG